MHVKQRLGSVLVVRGPLADMPTCRLTNSPTVKVNLPMLTNRSRKSNEPNRCRVMCTYFKVLLQTKRPKKSSVDYFQTTKVLCNAILQKSSIALIFVPVFLEMRIA